MLTQDHLREYVAYDPETGEFRLIKDMWRRKAGTVINRNEMVRQRSGRSVRYCRVSFDGRNYPAGHLAWFYMTGEWPSDEIDHRDTDGWNQRFDNLRPATRSQNQANCRRYGSNTVGAKGVYRAGGRRPFRAMIQKDKRRISLGRFETEAAALAAYARAAVVLHGEFARAA